MNTLCFEQILNKSSSFILINDSIRLSAMSILVDIGKRALKNSKSLVVLLTETSPKVWKKQFESTKDIHIIDCYTDPYGWDNMNKTNDDPNVQLINNITDIENSILLPLIKQVNDTPCCTILVDSLASLFMVSQFKTYQLVKTLESLTTDTTHLVIRHHSDIKLPTKNGLSMQESINKLATVTIKLEALKERTHFDTQVALTGFTPQDTFSYLTTTSNAITKGGVVNIEWRKKSGKVTYETNGFLVRDGILQVVPASQLTGVVEVENQPEEMQVDNQPDPAANLSFNLSLTDEQRKAKENLVLPYYKAQQLEVNVEEQKKQGGLIYYDPDAADDFDDEDPDDDLDI
ncbi:hypothetical protein G6F46_001057 [Rhizopus delemar]|nr:hypothetical protein G6F55_000634 [Rhizopus delemar]KAG1552532.1 hypothetical protein G6F51_001154 [Rhizopus arrhizus]KAG1505152.1 hypothetical protein G6F54_000522 [Rhizopus delemar]KAG1519110.1 hypothetical protein G6F53_000060 [Rhizopus delemar]KAG1528953.1 hypothetical protein G6F52_000172 [Rhizopus delemar]